MGATLTDPLVGRLVDGRYLVVSRIARGGMATVYRAVDRRLDREVALKVMHPHLADGAEGADFVSRFRREARAAARLAHPGLVAVFDQGVDGDTSYLTMELVDGTTLRRRLREAGTLSVGAALDVAESILEALAAAHRSNLVHRDIKPENVLIGEDDRVKVADFGLARAVTEVTSTATGTVFGTVAYLAPEIILTGSCDARTDVYAVGVLLFEMMTGVQPHTGATPIQVAYRHVNVDVPDVSSIVPAAPTEVDELVAAFAAREADHRPTDASAALDLLRRTRSALTEADLALRHEVAPAPEDDEPGDASEDTSDGARGTADGHPPVPPPPGDDADGASPASPPSPASAESPGSPEDAADDGLAPGDLETEALGLPTTGTTIALPIGAGVVEKVDTSAEARRGARRRRSLVAVLVVVLVAALTGGVTLWWAEWGPGAYTTVPSGLVGSEEAAASLALTTLGLTVAEPFTAHDDEVPEGSVVSVDPTEGSAIRKDGTVRLTVSLGVLMRTVPEDLVGATREEAVAALEAAEMLVGPDATTYSDDVPAGEVMAVSEEGGASVPHFTEVVLTVSLGPAPVTVPQVEGATKAVATEMLEGVGLVVDADSEYSETVPKGSVVSQDPVAATEAHRTDTVKIVVSKGPPLVEVPDVRRLPTEEAHAKLEAAGLVPKDQLMWGGFLGQVRFQDVDPGTEIPKGSTVTLTIF